MPTKPPVFQLDEQELWQKGKPKEVHTRFLIISHPKFITPPEIIPSLVDAMSAWVDQHTASGKLEFARSLAGQVGGGGILNVDSAEELDADMVGFPFGPFSEIVCTP
jgi:hypothetical protein